MRYQSLDKIGIRSGFLGFTLRLYFQGLYLTIFGRGKTKPEITESMEVLITKALICRDKLFALAKLQVLDLLQSLLFCLEFAKEGDPLSTSHLLSRKVIHEPLSSEAKHSLTVQYDFKSSPILNLDIPSYLFLLRPLLLFPRCLNLSFDTL